MEGNSACRLCYWLDGFVNVELNFYILQLSNAVEHAGKLVDELLTGMLALNLVDFDLDKTKISCRPVAQERAMVPLQDMYCCLYVLCPRTNVNCELSAHFELRIGSIRENAFV